MMKETIVIGMPVRNNEETLKASITSFLNQKHIKRNTLLLIANDHSSDASLQVLSTFLPDERIRVIEVNCGQVYAVRNAIHAFIRNSIPDCCMMGRLDADDILLDDTTLARVEKRFDDTGCDVLMMGNRQKKNGSLLEWINVADRRFSDQTYLLHRLKGMANGDPFSELPSCNTFIRPFVNIDYPEKMSAEDHWFTVSLLVQTGRLKIEIAEDLIYCIYSLDGNQTRVNYKKDNYLKSRKELFEFYKDQVNTD